MNYLKYTAILFVALLALSACNVGNSKNKNEGLYQCPMKCEAEKTYQAKGACPVCKMDLKPMAMATEKILVTDEISETSIFNLTTEWNTEEGKTIHLEDLKGKTLVMVMIYTSCKAACPRLVADMRSIEKQIPKELIEKISFVFVSIDPEIDTPKKLKAFAIENFMDDEHHTFLQGTESGVREFSNVLAVKYKQISPMDFSHSNIISVFSPQGELVHQQEGLGVDNKVTVSKIIETANK